LQHRVHRVHLVGTRHSACPGQAGQDGVHVLLGEVALNPVGAGHWKALVSPFVALAALLVESYFGAKTSAPATPSRLA
jgi:hypothetical protein